MAAERKDKQTTPAEQSEETTAKPAAGSDKPKKAGAAKAKPETRAARAKPKAAPKEKTEAPAERAETKKSPEAKAERPKARRRPARRPRTRSAPEPAADKRPPERPVVRARAKYVRSSARKARLVIEHLRGKSIEDARAVLRHTPRGVARDLEKLLESAVANAENNHDLVGDDLCVKEVYADEGPTIKRFRPRALGRATRIRKRTSHLTLTLTPKD